MIYHKQCTGETQVDLNGYHSLGATAIGIDNYKNIINDNGNPSDIVISTIGYGVDIKNDIFKDRIDENYYNFILQNKDVTETIEQGSRIGEVLADSTTSNVKIMPLVTVTEEGYTSISSIIKAITYAVKKSDIICYELINAQNDAIDLVLENAFKENVPICAVSSNGEENYPAKHGKTIAISSVDRNFNLADYSSHGDYIDFAAPSTDIEEIFKKNSTVSRWSGPQYSNAQIVSIIALIKTYNKEATILDIYNFLRNYSVDLGESGKDINFGYGCPNLKNLSISDIDKESPNIEEITFDNEVWEVVKQIKIIATDNIRISSWAVTESEDMPKQDEWKVLEQVTPNLDVAAEITENGKYYIWVQDSAGNTANTSIEINKIDNEPPKIAYTINKEKIEQGYVVINVTAEDAESGLYDSPFSWDKRTWSQDNSKRVIKQNGRYKIYAVDNLGNTSEQEILVDCFPQEGRYELGEGNIISLVTVSADWNENINNNVQIVLNKDLDIRGWQITTSVYVPTTFNQVNVNQSRTQNSNTENNTNTNTTQENYSLPNNVTANNVRSNNTNTNDTTSNSTNTANTVNTSNTSNTSNTANTASTDTTNQDVPINNEPISITTQLEIDTIYYLWTIDSNRNVSCQVFRISKAQI